MLSFFFQKVLWENDLFSMTERICIQSTEWRKSFNKSDERKKGESKKKKRKSRTKKSEKKAENVGPKIFGLKRVFFPHSDKIERRG